MALIFWSITSKHLASSLFGVFFAMATSSSWLTVKDIAEVSTFMSDSWVLFLWFTGRGFAMFDETCFPRCRLLLMEELWNHFQKAFLPNSVATMKWVLEPTSATRRSEGLVDL